MKNYIGFINDHSGSMRKHVDAAINDYNNTIKAVRDAATREMLDTVVSVVGVGVGSGGYGTERQVQASNPHVLKPITRWPSDGGTPLYDGIGDMISLMLSMPDADKDDVSFLLVITTDGEEAHSRTFNKERLAALIKTVQDTGRWTITLRAPKNASMVMINGLGIPLDNIQRWDTTSSAGLSNATAANTAAMDGYFTQRAAGNKATSAFYANAAAVNVALLNDVSKEVSLYVVPEADNGIEIRPFILRHRMEHLKGSAFYQLTKTEAKVQHDKQVLVRDRASGKIFAGTEARTMIGLPIGQNARLHPGDHKAFDLFIQSNSINRKLVGGTGVVYWKSIGKPFTAEDLAYLGEKSPFHVPGSTTTDKPPVVQLPAVPVSTTPTKSPIPVTPRPVATTAANDPGPANEYFANRWASRLRCAELGIPQRDVFDQGALARKGQRWVLLGSDIKRAMEAKAKGLKKAA